jgi:hypothetical protein
VIDEMVGFLIFSLRPTAVHGHCSTESQFADDYPSIDCPGYKRRRVVMAVLDAEAIDLNAMQDSLPVADVSEPNNLVHI